MKKILGILGLFLALLAAGCSTPEGRESDLPWNTPQPWETAPSFPGLDGR